MGAALHGPRCRCLLGIARFGPLPGDLVWMRERGAGGWGWRRGARVHVVADVGANGFPVAPGVVQFSVVDEVQSSLMLAGLERAQRLTVEPCGQRLVVGVDVRG